MHLPLKSTAGLLAACLFVAGCAKAGSDAWVSAPGFEAVDVGTIAGDAYYTPARFPTLGASPFLPDSALAAPVRAVLLVDQLEGLLPHARYRVEWQVVQDAEMPERMLHQVQVERFNLGPARHADVRQYVDEEHLAPVESFGEGPHVAWRFTMAPHQGMRAGLVEASRRLMDEGRAAAADCLGARCLQLEAATGPDAPGWHPREVAPPSAGYRAYTDSGPVPARVMDDLVAAIGEEAEMPVAAAKAPRFVFVISSNVEGQELLTTALGRDSVVMDDAIGAVWIRWSQVADAAAESALLYQPRH